MCSRSMRRQDDFNGVFIVMDLELVIQRIGKGVIQTDKGILYY